MWMNFDINGLTLYTTFYIHPFTRTSIHWGCAGQQPAHQKHFGIKYLAQRHIDMWTGGAANQTTDLLISG